MRVVRRPIRRLSVLAAVVLSLAAPSAALAAYGAIAVNSRTGSWGISYRAASLSAAERRARRECQGECRVLLWVRNQCAAAVATSARFWGGWGRNRTAAIGRARHRAHDRRAQLIAWTCSG